MNTDRVLISFLTANLLFFGVLGAQDHCKPVGWATMNGGTTGGGNATPVIVSNYADLKSNLISASVKVVYIKGVISIPSGGRISIDDQTGKTIAGFPGSRLVNSSSSKDGSGILRIRRCKNFIIRNLVLEGGGAYDTDGGDNLGLDDCQNFWIDHCEFEDGVDGNFDIKNMTDFISVTWCIFAYKKPPKAGGPGGADDHRFSNLIGSTDGATADEGKLSITFYYCWWAEGCRERMPRMRFGKLHMANNYFSSSVTNSGIRAGFKANVFAEGNYFLNQKRAIDEYQNNYTAIKATNNFGAPDMNLGTAFIPPYTLAVAAPEAIVTPIKNCAGAVLSNPADCSKCNDAVHNHQYPVVNKNTVSASNGSIYNVLGKVVSDKNNSSGPAAHELQRGIYIVKEDHSTLRIITK